ncbi:MAG: metallopeptidase [Candidatus Diapherotrites archaeon]|uniref:Metallopeptidase n=1 Tax=Candidatus Iainarchaeum sp. TaxID=3101447 RepID=A0A8T4C690_9ARCH|nr:metallopeptidase [Candidatus Diapherotrites archaeon]
MKYTHSPEWTTKTMELIRQLEFRHIPEDRVTCFKSIGSKSRRVIARIHTMPKIIQLGINQPPFYAIELVSEKFDRQSQEEQIKTIIHELLHIPHSFNGGFRQHRPYVNKRTVDHHYQKLTQQTRILPGWQGLIKNPFS